MFHVITPETSDQRTRRRRASKCVSKGSACLECRRRKVACSEKRPCGSCIRFKCEDRCIDSRALPSHQKSRQKRPSPSPLRTSTSTPSPNNNHNTLDIVKKLFPNVDPNSLVGLSRSELVSMVNSLSHSHQDSCRLPQGSRPIPPSRYPELRHHDRDLRETEDCLDWVEEYGWEENLGETDGSNPIADDVNGLAASLGSRSSYLGAPSIAVVLNVISKLNSGSLKHGKDHALKPGACQADPPSAAETPLVILSNAAASVSSHSSADTSSSAILLSPSPSIGVLSTSNFRAPAFTFQEGLRLIDAYFQYAHPTAPVVCESSFRQIYASKQPKHPSWLALLYAVLAWGSVVVTSGDSVDDIAYYKASLHYMKNLGSSGNIEHLQAMILMGCHYCHYRNMPNTAMAYTGAAFKIACGLGLHRELPSKANLSPLEREARRRIWWALYRMEIIGLFTLGRPSMFSGSGITVEMPLNVLDGASDNAMLAGAAGDGRETQLTPILPMIIDVGLCHILEKIEEMYLRTSSPDLDEVLSIDNELVEWYAKAAPLHFDISSTSCPKTEDRDATANLGISFALVPIRWQYRNARMVLYRTFLLRATLKKVPSGRLDANIRQGLEKCREVAAECITGISLEWRPHKLVCWPAVWYLFQAAMIPLVSLFSADRHDPESRSEWIRLVEQSLNVLQQMSPWRYTAKKSADLISSLCQSALSLPPISDVSSSRSPGSESSASGCSWEDVLWSWDDHEELAFCFDDPYTKERMPLLVNDHF